MPDYSKNLDGALVFARDSGIPVFPVQARSGKDIKSPLIKAPFENSSLDETQIRSWAQQFPGCAFAAYPGKAGFAVVDLDRNHKDGADGGESIGRWELDHGFLPETLQVTTPSGGEHLWFRDSLLDGKKDGLMPGVDVHGGKGPEGGYALIPGSVIESGCYTVIKAAPVAPLPEVLAREVNAARSKKAAPEVADGKPATGIDIGSILGEITGMAPIPLSRRDNTLFAMAAEWKNRGLSSDGMLALFQMMNHLEKIEQTEGDEKGDSDFRRIIRSVLRSSSVPFGNKSLDAIFETVSAEGELTNEQMDRYLADGDYSAADLPDMNLPELKWIIPDYLPAGLTVLAGPSKAGKSYFILQLCNEITKAAGMGRFLDKIVGGKRALYFALEDSKNRIRSRFRDLYGEDYRPPRNLTIRHTFRALDTTGLRLLRREIERTRPDALIIDTWQKVRKMLSGKANAYEKEYAEISALKALADEFNIAIIIIHHFKKYKRGDVEDAVDKLNGSAAIAGAADTVCLFERKDRGDIADLAIVGRDVADSRIVLAKAEPMGWKFSAENKKVFGVCAETPAQQAILGALETSVGGLTVNEIAAECPEVGLSNIKVILKRWTDKGYLCRVGRGKYSLSEVKEETAQ